MNGVRSTISGFYSRRKHHGLFYGRSAGFISFAVFVTFVSIMISILIFDFIFNIGGK